LSRVDVSVLVNKYRSLCCCAAGTLRSMCVCVRAAIVRRICGLRLWRTGLPMKGRVRRARSNAALGIKRNSIGSKESFANVSGGTGGGGRRIVEQEGGLIERGPKPYCRYRGGAAREGNLQRIRRNDTGLRADGSAMLRTSTTATLLGITNATTQEQEQTGAFYDKL
jgi:hypothetical protein